MSSTQMSSICSSAVQSDWSNKTRSLTHYRLLERQTFGIHFSFWMELSDRGTCLRSRAENFQLSRRLNDATRD